MSIRVLFVSSDGAFLDLQQSVLASSLNLICFPVAFSATSQPDELRARVGAGADDVILLDWGFVEAGTPDLVRELLARNPSTHIVALLPQSYRQYRQSVWEAGACTSIPKENIDQEWLSSILCVMQRAMLREAKLLQHAHDGA